MSSSRQGGLFYPQRGLGSSRRGLGSSRCGLGSSRRGLGRRPAPLLRSSAIAGRPRRSFPPPLPRRRSRAQVRRRDRRDRRWPRALPRRGGPGSRHARVTRRPPPFSPCSRCRGIGPQRPGPSTRRARRCSWPIRSGCPRDRRGPCGVQRPFRGRRRRRPHRAGRSPKARRRLWPEGPGPVSKAWRSLHPPPSP